MNLTVGSIIAGIGLIASLTGSWFTSTLTVNNKISAASERTAVVETEVSGLKDDVAEIKADVKSLLKAFNVKTIDY